MRKLCVLAFACVLSSLVSADTDINGTWSTAKNAQPRMVLEFKSTGTTLTGTVHPGNAPEPVMEILDGKVVGNAVTFKVDVPEADSHYFMMFSGRRTGNRIAFKCDVEVNPPG